MDIKEKTALAILESVMVESANPISLCSFGKDSIVVLHLALRIRKIPVMCWRLEKFQEKNKQANAVSILWDLELYDTWPLVTFEYMNREYFEVMNIYGTGRNEDGLLGILAAATGVQPYDNEDRFLCAKNDLLGRPRNEQSSWPWSVTIHGHKSADDIDIGQMKITKPISPLGATTLVCPIHDWTDDDVWAYIHRYNLPYDVDRYDNLIKKESPDSYPTCGNCLNPLTKDMRVWCPKDQKLIMNVSRTQEAMDADMAALKQHVTYCDVSGDIRTTPHLEHVMMQDIAHCGFSFGEDI